MFPICVMLIYDQQSDVPWTDESFDHPTKRSTSEPVGLTVGLLPLMNSYEGRS